MINFTTYKSFISKTLKWSSIEILKGYSSCYNQRGLYIACKDLPLIYGSSSKDVWLLPSCQSWKNVKKKNKIKEENVTNKR
jgi:hypothetical protein